MMPKYGLVLAKANSKSIRGEKSKRNTGGLCEWHMLSQTSININWEIQQASLHCTPNMSSQPCCTKVWLNGHSYMLELVQWSFLSWGMQKNLSPNFIAYGFFFQNLGNFEKFQKENVVVRFFFTSNVAICKQPCDLRVIEAVKKRCKLLIERCTVTLSTGQWQPTVTKRKRF